MAMETTAGSESSLSTWAGPYVTDMLGKSEALANLPFQPYTGQLAAGAAPLQTQAFQGIGGLTVPSNITQAGQTLGQLSTTGTPAYQPGTFTPTAYSQQAIQPYMNPYLESVLEPQRREATRQADIARQAMQGRMAQAGAYGGSRQALMESEANRNLQTLLGDITGKGYASAFDTAQQQFANEQARRLQAAQLGEQSRQFGQTSALQNLQSQIQAAQAQAGAGAQEAQYGLANVAQQLAAGQQQRDIEQQGLTAAYNQFLREEQYPQQRLEFQRQMLAGLPIAAASFYQPAPSAFQSAAGGALTAAQLLKILGQIG